MSLGGITAAIVGGNPQLQIALASLNLDVSLIKMEAPKEFQPLALTLPSKRKAEAEDGTIHATVRKLQSLFGGLYTTTPALYSAYGVRSSYISQQAKADEKLVKAGGAFAEHIGVEGSSIWAAATSGTTAVAIHLLACMLARVFSAAEAVAAWEEIVAIRKQQIIDEAQSGPTDNMFALLAAKTPLQRHDLAEWDASARAWLRVADEVMRQKQKQLLLIVNNQPKLPVNLHGSTFDSIVQSWSRAMIAVDKLIQGMPQSIVDGSILLALSAWHIYPDMSVLGDKNVFVQQNDDLIANGGVLTLGLQTNASQLGAASEEGVAWSLPLAYYRYYGSPRVIERNMETDGSRLSVTQLFLISIGSLMSGWIENGLTAARIAAFTNELFMSVSNVQPSAARKSADHSYIPSARSWPSLLGEAALSYTKSDGLDKEEGNRLIAFGRRRCREFLGLKGDKKSTVSQLQNMDVFLPLLQGHDARVKLLRRVAQRLSVPPDRLLIRYTLDGPERGQMTGYEYANVGESRLPNSIEPGQRKLCRWQSHPRATPERSEEMLGLLESDIIRAPVKDDLRLFWCNTPKRLQTGGLIETGVDEFFGHFAERAIFKKVDRDNPRKLKGVPFYFVLGDPASAAIYQAYDSPSHQSYLLRTEEILPSLQDINQVRLLRHLIDLTNMSKSKHELRLTEHVHSLKALATIGQVYERLPSATIATSLVKSPLANAKWLPTPVVQSSGDVAGTLSSISLTSRVFDTTPAVLALEPLSLDRPSTFACIAMMESGIANIPPDGLATVMALSSSDSLYVACQLVNDPAQPANGVVTHIRGNIGRPGICMMIPPSQELFTMNIDNWHQVDHDDFDGELRDSFTSTSLHLSFTEFSLAVDTGNRGTRSTEVVLLETVLSVHERGLRIADLDILASVDAPLLRIISSKNKCSHSNITMAADDDDGDDHVDETLVSLDSWAEFLDSPTGTGVFRAHGNWQARLAAAALSITRDYLTIVFDGEVCWPCGRAESKRMRHKKTIFVI